MTRHLSCRDWLRLATAGALGASMSGWLPALAADAAKDPRRKRACVLLWMNGGPSQMDPFDLKPGHANGGPFKEIQTSAPGLKFSEYLPKIAKCGDRMAVIRSMSTKEGDHGRASLVMHTGYTPGGPIQYPTLGSLVAKELGDDGAELPSFVSIDAFRGAGFLGPRYAPLVLAPTTFQAGEPDYAAALRVPDLAPAGDVTREQAAARVALLREAQKEFGERHGGPAAHNRASASDRAVRLMPGGAASAFDLDREKDTLRDAYGRNLFGQGCLLARRLVERNVPFVEVSLGGWDTHGDNFNQVKRLSETLDNAWAALMGDLKDRGLLDTTLVVWMGEFGRTPKINGQSGRDHFPNAWSTVLAGGGVKGGRAYGKTSADGMTVEERPVSVPDFLATACLALGIDPEKQNQSNVGRPIRIVDKTARPLREAVA